MIRTVFLSDVHVMSRHGIVPPEWRQRSDPLRPVQEYIWDCWTDFVRSCPKLDNLVFVGDLIDGTIQLRGQPRGVASDDLIDQIEAATAVLTPLARKARQVYVVRGTPFHETGDAVEAIARGLPNAVAWAAGRYSGHVLTLELGGLNVDISHHQTRGWMWLGGAASRLAVLSAAAEAAAKLPRADVIVRGDLHTYVLMRTLQKWICFLPGWTMPSLHAIQRMEATRAHLAADIGGLMMTIDRDGSVGWREWIYPLYKREIVKGG
ncbi:MAG: hypothetical protein KatS3mg109_1974 [Pirellulaceae bacterium]|nr:MAG: hypothetical protein KatS3mg109_1974 [Pirellulaceae bacterium]